MMGFSNVHFRVVSPVIFGSRSARDRAVDGMAEGRFGSDKRGGARGAGSEASAEEKAREIAEAEDAERWDGLA